MKDFRHVSVLLDEAVDALNVIEGCKYIDATLGGGGHSLGIIQRGGIVLGLDQDEDAIEFVKEKQKVKIKEQRMVLVKGNFRDIAKIAKKSGFGQVDGILFDLGVSSYQLDNSKRGFSFLKDEKLDMRMDKGSPLSACEVVNKYPYEKLVDIFYKYGEEHNAKEIARQIVDTRKRRPIDTSLELSRLIAAVSHKPEAIHPATRVFQAIRVEVNDEINALREGLARALELLEDKGRIVVISFHSLEDRVAKQTFDKFGRAGKGKVITKKPLTATFEENKKNRRARSAKLRIFEKYEQRQRATKN